MYVPPREIAWHTDPTYPPTASGYWLPRWKSTAGCPAAWYLSTASWENDCAPKGACLAAAWSPDGKCIYSTSDAGTHGSHICGSPFPTGSRSSLRLGPRKNRTLPWRPMATRSSRRSATTHARSGFMTRMETGKFPPKATPPVTAIDGRRQFVLSVVAKRFGRRSRRRTYVSDLIPRRWRKFCPESELPVSVCRLTASAGL